MNRNMIKMETAHKEFIDNLSELGRSRSTVIAYEKDIEQLIEFLYKQGVNELSDVELEHLESFMKNLAQKDYTKKSISRKTNSTKTFFNYLVEAGHAKNNAAENLKHPKVEAKEPRILSRLEYGALRDVTREDARTFAIVEVLLQTGVRIAELASIKIEDVEINDNKGTLAVRNRRGHLHREIPLNKAVVEAINKYHVGRPQIEDSVHLFITKTGNPLLVRNIRATITRYFKEAGIENAKVNDLRHTFVAHHLAHGTSINVVSKVAGHKRLSTTERYLEFIEKHTEDEKTELGIL